MGVAPADTLAVGDYKFDVMAGRSAGCRTVLVRQEQLSDAELADWGSPDLVIQSLRELRRCSAPTDRRARQGQQ